MDAWSNKWRAIRSLNIMEKQTSSTVVPQGVKGIIWIAAPIEGTRSIKDLGDVSLEGFGAARLITRELRMEPNSSESELLTRKIESESSDQKSEAASKDFAEEGQIRLRCDHAGALVIPFTTTPDALGPEVREQAITFANKMT